MNASSYTDEKHEEAEALRQDAANIELEIEEASSELLDFIATKAAVH